jgi:hypothetical protein
MPGGRGNWRLVKIQNLSGLRAGHDSGEVGILAALPIDEFLGRALIAAALFILLLLSTNLFSAAFFHRNSFQ